MAKKRKPKNRIWVDSWNPGGGWRKSWQVFVQFGRRHAQSEEMRSKVAAQAWIDAIQALMKEPLPVDWNP